MIVITTAFTGYPNGEKRRFIVDEKPKGIDRDYAALLVSKGLAKRIRTKEETDEAK